MTRSTDDPHSTDAPLPEDIQRYLAGLSKQQKVVLVMDLVESVRLMEANEAAVVGQWRGFVQHARDTVLPAHHGRLVKSLGDGIMVEFDDARQATRVAFELHNYFMRHSQGDRCDHALQLRAGVHITDVYADDLDIYGHGVNLAARIAGLGAPGETLVSARVLDAHVAGLDLDAVDLGECHLKHIPRPVRVYKVHPVGRVQAAEPDSGGLPAELAPTVAVLAFECRSTTPSSIEIGHVISDGVIGTMAPTGLLRVISPLSSLRVGHMGDAAASIGQHWHCQYLVKGSYLVMGSEPNQKLLLTVNLVNASTNAVIWQDRFHTPLDDLFEAQSDSFSRISQGVHHSLINEAAHRGRDHLMPTLESSTLLLGGIGLMHRSALSDVRASRTILNHLIERHPKGADAHAWLTKSLILNAVSQFAEDPDAIRASVNTIRLALQRFEGHALSLAMQAHIHTHIDPAPEKALHLVTRALAANPNEAHAWLFKSVLSSMWGNTRDAVVEARQAMELSPADPLGFYYRMILAAALTSNREYDAAIDAAEQSLKLNHVHTPTLRVLITALVFSGQDHRAQQAWDQLIQLDPTFTASRYLSAGNADSRTKQEFVQALRALGV